jgi:uncharacterized surface protein with fasciclin (FAS1) repeats
MKTNYFLTLGSVIGISFLLSCGGQSGNENSTGGTTTDAASTSANAKQADINDETSQPNVVKIAVGSPDHTTLVTAVSTADLVNALSNNGPFTVFAPTNAAFDALPAGTVEGLLKPDQKDALSNILEYHVFVGVLKTENLQDGQIIGMVNGSNATIHVKDGKYMVNDANIVASVPASNGIVHVIDKVIFQPAN